MAREYKRPYVDFNETASSGEMWHAQLFVSKGKGGRPGFSLSKSECPDRRDFIDKAHARAVELRSQQVGIVTIDPDMLFADFAKGVISNRRVDGRKTGDHVSERTKAIYTGIVDSYIGPVMGALKLKQISTAAFVQRCITQIEANGGERGALSKGSLHDIGNVLRMLLREMITAGRFSDQQLRSVEFHQRPAPLRKRKTVRLSVADLQHAFRRLEKPLDKVRFILGFVLGMRAGEILALKWTDLEPQSDPAFCARVKVHATITTDLDRKTIYSDTAKTDAGTRDLLLLADFGPALQQWKEEQVAIRRMRGLETDSGEWFVASNREGTMAHEGAMRGWFDTKIAQGIFPEGFTTHNLRHSHGSYFGWANGTVGMIQAKLMGHGDAEVTRSHYADAIDEEVAAHVKQFGSKLPMLLQGPVLSAGPEKEED